MFLSQSIGGTVTSGILLAENFYSSSKREMNFWQQKKIFKYNKVIVYHNTVTNVQTQIQVNCYTGDVPLKDETLDKIIDSFVMEVVYATFKPEAHPQDDLGTPIVWNLEQERVESLKTFLLAHGVGNLTIINCLVCISSVQNCFFLSFIAKADSKLILNA